MRWLGQEGQESSDSWTTHFWLLVGSLPQVGPEPPLASLRPPPAQRLTRAFPPCSLYLPPSGSAPHWALTSASTPPPNPRREK